MAEVNPASATVSMSPFFVAIAMARSQYSPTSSTSPRASNASARFAFAAARAGCPIRVSSAMARWLHSIAASISPRASSTSARLTRHPAASSTLPMRSEGSRLRADGCGLVEATEVLVHPAEDALGAGQSSEVARFLERIARFEPVDECLFEMTARGLGPGEIAQQGRRATDLLETRRRDRR